MDVLVRVLRLQEQELGDDQVGDVVLHGTDQKDHPLLEQPGKNIEGAFAAGGLLDDDGHQPKPLGLPIGTS